MNAKTRFLKMYSKLPENARRLLIYMDYTKRTPEPYSMYVVSIEVRNNTELSKRLLVDLGYVDE